SWNARNQVATLNSVSLQYDAFGRRTKNAAGKSFLFDGANATEELSGTTPTASLLTGGIDELFQRTDGNGTVVPLTDALGSVIALTNTSGSVVTTYSYDPFGNTTTAGAADANPSQYTGRENDSNGLYFYRARYYSPVFGRFVSQDPLGIKGSGSNLYAYNGDDPIDYTDPYGLIPIPDYVTLSGSVGLIVSAGVNVSVNLHNGNVYVGGHLTGGAQVGPGGSLVYGVLQPFGAPWDSSIDNSANTAAQVDAFLGGLTGFGCIGNWVGGCVS